LNEALASTMIKTIFFHVTFCGISQTAVSKAVRECEKMVRLERLSLEPK
jgi:hypothetical protein